MFSKECAASLALGALIVTAGCGGNGTMPGSAGAGGAPQLSLTQGGVDTPADTNSILKKLTKDVVIGTTVDPKNGDTGPHSLQIVQTNYGLKKGQLLTCNFADSSGTPGNGTTIEVLNPAPGSSPKTFFTNTKIKGCDGNAISGASNQVYPCGMTSGICNWVDQKGKYKKKYGSPIVKPFADGDIYNPGAYAAEYIMVGDVKTGGVVSFAIGPYGNPKETQVISGFGVSGSGWSALGPSGFQYDKKKDVMYIADGNTNTIVSVSHPGNLLVKNEIVIQSGGKKFKCAHPKDSCAKLVLAGKPLNGPVALALLPNGNLIAANTKNNMLVELTPAGQVLATKTADQGNSPAVFGLAASGKNDTNTTLFYTDTNDNNVHQLQQ
jgi:hypothetical protein